MKLDLRLLSLVGAAALLAPGVARADDPATVREAYQQLLASGCDATKLGSPISARVLRNVPYAQQGKIFKSPELTYLYEHDGGWYTPTDANADVTAADRACVRKLDAQEVALRKRVKLKKPIEQAITRHTGGVLEMTRLVESDFRKFKQTERTVDGMREWSAHFEGGGAALISVLCRLPAADAKAKPPAWGKLDCHVIAAG